MTALTRRRRGCAALGVLAISAVVLSGCKMEINLALNEDDTADGSFIMAMSAEEQGMLEAMGMSADELWGQMSSEMGELGENGEVRDYNQDGMTGKEIVFRAQSIDTAGGAVPGDQLSITRDGNDFVVSGTLDMSDTGGMEDAMSGVTMEVKLNITFPGAVSDANGVITGNTVSWDMAVGASTSVFARGSAITDGEAPVPVPINEGGEGAAPEGGDAPGEGAEPEDGAAPEDGTVPADWAREDAADADDGGGGSSLPLILGIVAGVLVLLVIAVVLVMRSSGSKKKEGEAAAAPPAAWPQPGYPPAPQPGYPPPAQPGYPPAAPGYPPPAQTGYPPAAPPAAPQAPPAPMPPAAAPMPPAAPPAPPAAPMPPAAPPVAPMPPADIVPPAAPEGYTEPPPAVPPPV